MKYLIYQTEQEAEDAQAEIWEQLKPDAEYRNGQPVEPITVRWATPQELTDGRWAIPSHNDEGEELNPEVFLGIKEFN